MRVILRPPTARTTAAIQQALFQYSRSLRRYSQELKELRSYGVKTNVWWRGLRQKDERFENGKTGVLRHKDIMDITSVVKGVME